MGNVTPLRISGGRVAPLPSTDVLVDSSTAVLPYASFKSSASAPTVNDDNTAGYRVGSLWVLTGTGTFYVCSDASTGAAVWNSFSGSVFGLNYQSASDVARTTTTANTFQDKLSLVTAAVTGTYRISYEAVLDAGTPQKDTEVQIYDATAAAVLVTAQRYAPQSVTDRHQWSGFVDIVMVGAAKTLKIQFRSPDNNTTIGCRDARIEFWREI